MTSRAYPSRLGIRFLTVSLLALLAASPGLTQEVKPDQAHAAQPAPAAPTATKPGADDQTIMMSPFEVVATKDQGYYTATTLAGTRLNNNIADLASSISVVTRQQLEDTNSVNINDIFRYEANTEGASTYTPFTLVRSNMQDALGGGGGTTGNFTSALATGNRVRGLSTADLEVDNFFSSYRIPFDSYNTEAIEILRGPNSIIFGTGSPAGIVNQERTQANVQHLSGNVTLSTSSWGGYRQSISVNVPLLQDRLGLYVAQLYDSKGFEQKPSSDLTRRQYGALTFYPFKNHKTKFTANVERYSNYANDPNGISPVDNVTPWLASGRPIWNPINNTVTYLSTGKQVGPYAITTTYPGYNGITQTMLTTSTSPNFVPSMTIASATHNYMFIDQGNLENFFRGSQTSLNIPGWVPTTLTAPQVLVNQERMTTSTSLPNPAHYQTWYLPGVVNKDIYDWSTININSLDNNWTQATTYNASFQQEILSNLNFQVAWFRQNLKQIQDSPLAQANATTLAVDTNAFLPNGAPNPHVGQPFVDVYQSDVYSVPETNNNWRAMLDYEPDFRGHVPSWLNWLGHHRLLGVFTQHDDVLTNLRYRPSIDGGDLNYLPTQATLSNAAGYSYPSSNSAIEQFFYLGAPGSAADGHGNTSPGFFNRPGYGGPTLSTIKTYNYATGQWVNSQVHMDSLLFASGGPSENFQESKTFFWQGFLWDDRIVGTYGVNKDNVKNRNNVFPTTNPTALEYTNGMPNTQYWYNYGPWSYISGTTHTTGVVVKPFKDWARIDSAANGGSYFASFLRSVNFTFNKADNFNPPPANYTDYFGAPLGKPQGKEKDYGVEIATPDNKFFLRATWFNTTNENALVTLTSTARANYMDQTELKNWATKVVYVRNFLSSGYGVAPSDANFANTNIYPTTLAMQSQIAALTGLPYTYGGNVGALGQYVNPAATENGVAKGVEIDLTYNPLPNWTMKFSWGKQQTTVTGAAAQAQAWVNYRSAAWQAAVAPDLTTRYTLSNGTHMLLNNFWTGYGYDRNVTENNINGWTTSQNYYNAVVDSQLAIDEANNGALAPNQRQYSWSYVTNYTIDHGFLKYLSFGGALRYDGRAVAGYYGDEGNLNSTGQVAAPDITKPIYTPGRYHIDAWVAYTFKLPWAKANKVDCKVQLNVQDMTSNGYLLPVSYNFDGSPAAERIIAPRTFTLSTKFSF
jgi:outer membrane receptor protein involved in Fe transport